ncbi:unnamed protein product [Closterium sp. NIES-53]
MPRLYHHSQLAVHIKQAICAYHVANPQLRHVDLTRWYFTRFGIRPDGSTIGRVLKEFERWASAASDNNIVRVRGGAHPELERAMARWIANAGPAGVLLTLATIRGHVANLARGMSLPPTFRCSIGWVRRALRRQGVRPRDTYNFDEIALYISVLLRKTYGNGRVAGRKVVKDHLTVGFLINADGSHSFHPLVISKAKRPHDFRPHYDPEELCFWRNNAKGWMTSLLFTHFIEQLNAAMHAEDRHIVILLDNASSHVLKSEGATSEDLFGFRTRLLSNIRLVYLPPNTTCFSQPLDQGLIAMAKARYRQHWLRAFTARWNAEGATSCVARFKPNLRDVLTWLNDAWMNIELRTIQRCWWCIGCLPRAWAMDLPHVGDDAGGAGGAEDIGLDEEIGDVDPAEPVEVAVDSGAARGAEPAGAGTWGAKSGCAEPGVAEPGRVEPEAAMSGGAEPERAASGGALGVPLRREPLSPQQLREWASGGATGAGAAGGAAGAGGAVGVATGAGGAAGASGGAAGAGAAGAGGAAGVGAAGGAAGTGDPRGEGTGSVSVVSGGAVRPRSYYVPLLQQVLGSPPSPGPPPSSLSPPQVLSQSQLQPASPLPDPSPYSGPTRGLTERREPESRPVSPVSRSMSPVRSVRAGRVSRPRPPPIPGTHSMTLRPSTAPQRVPLPSPPASSLPAGPDPASDSLSAAGPAVMRFLATAVIDPLFESTAASALVAELVDFAATCRLEFATSLVAESASVSVCPSSVRGECALGMDVLEDRQEEFECFAASVPHLVSMLLALEGDPDAPDIPTPRSYAEVIEGPYSSQWQVAMDAEMASWKSTGTYVDEVPPPGANIVSGMWIFRVKRPPGSPPVFKARYVARGFSQRQGVEFFQTFSPTPKMTTFRVLLHVAAQRDYELHLLDFSTAFLQGSLHEEIWLRRPPGFTGSFPAGTQWSLRRPVYGLRQAPREWHDTLRTTLASLGFAPSTFDPSLFLRTDTTLPPFCVLVYVDDLVFATADTEALAHVKSELQKRHTCTDLGPSALAMHEGAMPPAMHEGATPPAETPRRRGRVLSAWMTEPTPSWVTLAQQAPRRQELIDGDVVEPVEIAVDSGASGGAEPERAEPGGAGSGGAEPEHAEPGGAGSGGAELECAEPGGAESGGAEPAVAGPGGPSSASSRRELPSPQELREWFARRWSRAAGAGGAAGAEGSTAAGGAGATGPGGARTGGTGAAGPGGATRAGATGGAGAGRAVGVGASGGTGAGGAAGVGAPVGTGVGATGAAGGAAGVGADAGGAGAVPAGYGGATRPRPYFVPHLEQVLGPPPSSGPAPSLECPLPVQLESQLQLASPLPAPSPYAGPTAGLAERREPESRLASPVRAARTSRRAPCQRPPAVPGTHQMALRPSTAPQRVPLPSPPASSLPALADPESDSLRVASPTVTRFLATVVTDPSFESSAASALVAELVDFAAHCRLDYAASLVAESASVCPSSVGGECALSTDVLEDRQEEFQCFAAALPHLVSMLLAPEGDPDAPDISTPRSYAEAIEGPYSSQWQVKRPPGSPPVFKARYVARGFSQRQGVDSFQTFSPTPKMTTLRGSLHEEIWLRRPPGLTGSFPSGTQWSLRRPVYGLRQAPGEWHDTLRTTLAALGFAPSTADPSLFLRTDTLLPPFYILVYVDDLVFATADTAGLAHVKSELQKRYTCTDLGELRSYLGLQITRDRARCTITLTQSHMVQQVLLRFDFTYSSPQATPLSTRHSLSALPSGESVELSGPYPELVGCLMYLMTCTRPDLAYPLSILARYVAPGRHRPEHMAAAKRVLRYLCSTSGMGLVLGGRSPVVLTGHADASWVDDLATQRSSQGYTFSLGSGSVSWRSTRSSSVLSSSCEAEIYAGAMATQELCWLTYLLTDLGEQLRSPPALYVDNKAMLALCREHRLELRTKHIALCYFLARELQQLGQLCLAYVASQANTADIFTKALQPCDHQRFCTMLGLLALLCFA